LDLHRSRPHRRRARARGAALRCRDHDRLLGARHRRGHLPECRASRAGRAPLAAGASRDVHVPAMHYALGMKLAVLVLLSSATAIAGPKLPPGFEIVEQSQSPDGKLAVIAPDLDHVKAGTRQNAIVEVASGKTIATIQADTTALHENHADMA